MTDRGSQGTHRKPVVWTLVLALAIGLLVVWWSLKPDPAQPSEPGRAEPRPGGTRAPSGRFGRRPVDDPTLTPTQLEMIEQLGSIGYTGGSEPVTASGVTTFQRERTAAGLNLYTSGHAPVAILMDLEGQELHRWSLDFFEVWPDSPPEQRPEPTTWWRRAHLLRNGDVLAIFEGRGILKVDRHSRLIWAADNGAHHDLEVLENGDIYVLTRQAHMLPRIDREHPILEDSVTVLDAEGELKSQFSLVEAFEDSEFQSYWESSRGPKQRRPGDIFHTNTLEVLDGRIADVIPAFRAGNLLVSMRTLDTIAVVDPELKQVVWAHKGNFIAQHDPSVLKNGHLLLFDNRGQPDRSTVLELEPSTLETVWQYSGSPDRPFFSKALGAAQRLENGNTLITESDGGRAFEVTPEGEVVWEYFNPNRAGANGEYIAAISEMLRLPPDFPTDWIP